ncbi:MAG: hypothetical protein M9916_04265 [Crocinitomicaceae bacterium]|nr:hypothetical protein [Crocinitomicaceae bacterium]
MKKISTLLLGLSLLISSLAFSQKMKYEQSSPFFLGLNAGATWHTTDVKNKFKWGAGFVFGASFNRDYGKLFSYDLKFRFLGGSWIGQDLKKTDFSDYDNVTLSSVGSDYKKDFGYSINNFRSISREFNLELSIHLNRLIERTGWDPYIFGGIGVTYFRAKGNVLDSDGFMYNYNTLDNLSKSSLSSFMDKSYETGLDGSHIFGNLEMMGHLGFGIGYYFNTNVAFGFEHKTTFTGGDRFDGVFANRGVFKKDLYHYSGLYLKLYLRSGKYKKETPQHTQPVPPVTPTPTDPVPPVTDPVPPVDCPLPVLSISNTSQTVTQPTFQVNGTVLNKSIRGVEATLNGVNAGAFSYSGTNNFTASFNLQPGLNTIVFTVVNNCGTDTKTIQVNYAPCVVPSVTFVQPTSSSTTSTNQAISVQAIVSNLGSGQIQYVVNNQVSSNYTYTSSNGQFTSTIYLQSGMNTIQIGATNACGTNAQTIYVQYNPVVNCPKPTITVHSPVTTSGTTSSIELAAVIENIATANQVDVYLNGIKQSTGTYTSRIKTFSKMLLLANGRNQILIRATNECGSTEQSFVYDYNLPCNEPTVIITNPSGRVTSSNVSYVVNAQISNVTNPSNIVLKVNGISISGFNYSSQTGILTATIQLIEGENTIELTATNECGKASGTASVTYNVPCVNPVITFVNPTTNIVVTKSDFTLEAAILNINSASAVTLTVNGVTQSQGTYNSATHLYSKNLSLQEGANLIQLTAKNNCGQLVSSTTITYKKAVVGTKPSVDITSNCNITISQGKNKFTGVVLGVTNTSQIQVKLNSQLVTNVAYTQVANGFSFELEFSANYSQTYQLEITATNAYGSVTKTCQLTGEAKPDNDIVICVPQGRTKVTMTIKESQWAEYQAMGASLGACPVVDNDITICLPNGKTNVTMVIKESQWAEYQAKGASLGACPDKDITICLPNGSTNVTMVIKESQWAEYKAKGASMGACPDKDITICMPQGRAKVTMTIKESQWAEYQAKGASMGACPDKDITICLPNGSTNVTMVIKESQWAEYQAKGASMGACPDKDITICMPQGRIKVTMTIKESQWAEYQAMGASLGACPDKDITICMPNGTSNITMTIKESQWAEYKAKGATIGACPQTNVNNTTDTLSNTVGGDKMTICVEENGVKVTKVINKVEWANYKRKGATEGACEESSESNGNKDTSSGKNGAVLNNKTPRETGKSGVNINNTNQPINTPKGRR